MGLTTYNPDGYIIRIGETAIMQMCLSGLEAYSVSHRGNKRHKTGLETYGLLFGHETVLPNEKTLYCIEFLDTDVSAERTRTSCRPNPASLTLKRDILTSFFPQYEFMGDFHTHPCTDTRSEIIKDGSYKFSPCDYRHIEGFSDHWRHHHYRVGIVVTISLMKKNTRKGANSIDSSTVEFTLGNYRLFLKGYIAVLDEDETDIMLLDDESVSLHCPSLSGHLGEYTEFGRGRKASRIRHVCGNI
jgi:hypothetical protein